MLKLRLFLPSLLFLTVFFLPSFAEDWVKFTPKTGDYSVLLPGEPKLNELAKNDTSFYIYNYYTNEQEPNKLYTIQCFSLDIPEGKKLTSEDIDNVLGLFKNNIVEDSSNRIIEEKKIKSKEGYPGLEVGYVSAKKNVLYILKSFIVGRNLILASVETDPNYKNNGNITKFFNSLELHNTKPYVLIEAKPQKEWIRFESEYGGFTVQFPEIPIAEDSSDSSKYANVFECIYEGSEGEQIILKAQFFPSDLKVSQYNDRAVEKQLFNSVISMYTANSFAKFKNETPITSLNRFRGSEFTFLTKNDSTLIKTRLYIVRDKIIALNVFCSPSEEHNDIIQKFLNSLVIFNRDSLDDIARSKVVWSEFKPENGVFKIEMPGAPTLNEQAIETNGIPVYHKYFNYFDDSEIDGRFTYEGYSAKIPKNLYDVTLKFVRNQLLHISSVGFIKNSDGALIYERPIEHENYPGVEVAGSLSNNRLYVKGRFFIVEDQLIAVYAVTTSDFEKSPNFDKYFNSLHFSKAAPKRTAEEPTWERVELKEVACAAEFPGSPKVLNNKSDGILFKGFHLKTDDNEDPNSDYIAQYSLIGIDPAKLEIPENAKEFLHSFVEGYYETVKGKLLKEEFIELNGYKGVAMTMIDATGSILISGRFYIVNGYRVSATVNSTPQFDDNPNMRKFFNSIVLPKD